MGAIALVEVERRGALRLRTPEDVARDGLARRRALEPDREQGETCDAPLRALRVAHDRCTGCRACEVACDEANRPRTVGGVTLAGPGDTGRALIRVHTFAAPGPYAVAWACQGCPDLPCVAACEAERFPADAGPGARRALHLDGRSGAVAFEPAFCTACLKCVDACAARGGGVLRWDPAEQVVGACHLCGGEPACVPACPEGAIELVVVDRTRPLEARCPEEVARRWAERALGGRS
jgi:Fe-S-cluster-containing dehydrogenase component